MRTRTWRRRALAVLLAPVLTTAFLSLVPAPASAVSLANGGFETGDFTSWTLPGTTPAPIIDTQVVKSGTYSAYLGAGIPSGSGDSQIMQTVAVPAVGTTALDLDWWPYSMEYAFAAGGDPVSSCLNFDSQDVLVFDETGTTILGTLMHTCSNSQTWEHLSFDLTPWAGSTIGLVFSDSQDSSARTSMLVDNITVTTTTTYTTTAADAGWYDQTGFHSSANTNYLVQFHEYGEYRNWFVFNVESSAPTACGASLRLVNDYGAGTGGVYTLHAVTTAPAALTADHSSYSPQGQQIFADLADGDSYGQLTVAEADVAATPIVVPLNATGVAAFNAARGGMLAIGGQYQGTGASSLLFGGTFDEVLELVVQPCAETSTTTATALTSSGSPSVFGQSVDLTATVTADSGSDVPTGTVEFWEGTTQLDEKALNGSGVATLTVSDFAVGSHSVIAKYVPEAGSVFTASESVAFSQDVKKADTKPLIHSVTPANPTYGQTLSFDTTVDAVAPGDGTPSGGVTYKVNKFAGTPDATGYVDFVPGTDLLPAGTHHVQAYYAGDGNFNGSESNAFVVEVAQASSTVTYLGDYLAIRGNSFLLKANVDSPAAGCRVGRAVTFTLDDGVNTPIVLHATSGTGGAVSQSISNVTWPTGLYDVLVEVAETNNCTAASNALAEDVITVATPGDAATGGGWYFYKDAGAGKRVNFGFTVSKQTDNSYKGSLLLMNQGVWRLKGSLDSFTRDGAAGQAGGTGTLYQWVLANPSDPTSGSWVNPQVVSFKIAFTDEAAGKAGGKKTVVVDQFALSQISVKGATLPVSSLKPLKGGNIVLR